LIVIVFLSANRSGIVAQRAHMLWKIHLPDTINRIAADSMAIKQKLHSALAAVLSKIHAPYTVLPAESGRVAELMLR
jgi:hypothetical protein